MKATARYVLNVELKGDDEEAVLFDCQLFAKHLHLTLDTYAQIGTVNIDRYWMGDVDDPQKEEEDE